MRELVFDVSMQTIKQNKGCDFSNIVRGSDNYLECVFLFDSSWREYVKVASVKNVSGEEYNSIINNNRIVLPEYITQESMLYIKVVGKSKKTKIETNTCSVKQI